MTPRTIAYLAAAGVAIALVLTGWYLTDTGPFRFVEGDQGDGGEDQGDALDVPDEIDPPEEAP